MKTEAKLYKTALKRYEITYYLRPEYENITTVILAKNYEDAYTFAHDQRIAGFSVKELGEA